MKPEIRIGTGFDFHPFTPGRKLVLGGVEIPWEQGLGGHSDADVLSHALIDSLLGAAGLSDIGSYFPDTDSKYKDISSLILLEKAYRLLRGKGFLVGNIDLVVLAEAPKIKPWVPAIKKRLSFLLQVTPEDLGIKATTMEGRGVIGRGEGIAVQASALIYKDSPD
jgi:2-C-methyl-D-erythritol 2,4-cyclodiphosphate synthase